MHGQILRNPFDFASKVFSKKFDSAEARVQRDFQLKLEFQSWPLLSHSFDLYRNKRFSIDMKVVSHLRVHTHFQHRIIYNIEYIQHKRSPRFYDRFYVPIHYAILCPYLLSIFSERKPLEENGRKRKR